MGIVEYYIFNEYIALCLKNSQSIFRIFCGIDESMNTYVVSRALLFLTKMMPS